MIEQESEAFLQHSNRGFVLNRINQTSCKPISVNSVSSPFPDSVRESYFMLAYANPNTDSTNDSINRDIRFIEIRHLNGPNIWTCRPVLEAIVDIGELEDFPSDTIPGFYERLSSWLPSLIEHRCGYGERGGF